MHSTVALASASAGAGAEQACIGRVQLSYDMPSPRPTYWQDQQLAVLIRLHRKVHTKPEPKTLC